MRAYTFGMKWPTLLLAAVTSLPLPLAACTCAISNPCDSRNHSAIIVAFTVTEILKVDRLSDGYEFVTRARARIDRTWKTPGPASPEITVIAGANCNVIFLKPGASYIEYSLFGVVDGQLRIAGCGRRRPLEYAERDIRYLTLADHADRWPLLYRPLQVLSAVRDCFVSPYILPY